jgi:signal transduction histidine kinase
LDHAGVLIVSDETEFARTIAARWQSERFVPEITLVASDVWRPGSALGYDIVIIGAVRDEMLASIMAGLNGSPRVAAVYVADESKDTALLHGRYPQLLIVPRQDGWAGILILVCVEALRRIAAVDRAQRAERASLASQRQATLGRYMLDMRPSVNDALTSVLGNADLLLLEPGRASGETREQLQTIHTMALRLNEIIQRFSSLASEMRAGEKESHPETESAFGGSGASGERR